jgi:hypothetical protein
MFIMYKGGSILSGLYFLPEDVSTRKMKHFMDSWCPAGGHDQLLCIIVNMASDLIASSVEQCCIIQFLMKEKVKPAEIPCRLNA